MFTDISPLTEEIYMGVSVLCAVHWPGKFCLLKEANWKQRGRETSNNFCGKSLQLYRITFAMTETNFLGVIL